MKYPRPPRAPRANVMTPMTARTFGKWSFFRKFTRGARMKLRSAASASETNSSLPSFNPAMMTKRPAIPRIRGTRPSPRGMKSFIISSHGPRRPLVRDERASCLSARRPFRTPRGGLVGAGEARDDDGGVVLSSHLPGRIGETSAELLRGSPLQKETADRLVGQRVGETVGAQQQRIVPSEH